MFAWVNNQFESITNTLAPPPTDAASRFVYCVQKDDESGALGCVPELPGAGVIVNAVKGQMPLHVACQSCMTNVIRELMKMPGASLDLRDGMGNTPLHAVCMATKPNTFDVVKMLVTEYKASVTAKNNDGQTPYDVARISAVRQYLLPLQLQRETQDALDNGGVGLPPGIDLGGLKIKNSALPPPPSGAMGAPSVAGGMPPPPVSGSGYSSGMPSAQGYGNSGVMSPMPPPPGGQYASTPAATPAAASPLYGTPNPPIISATNDAYPSSAQLPHAPASGPAATNTSNIPPAPTSGQRDYALTGSSSAAIYRTTRGIQPDGFHSSSSDKTLQQKYGHSNVQYGRAIPPPPRSGDSSSGLSGAGNGTSPHPASAPPSMNGAYRNPYSAGAAFVGTRPGNRRYAAVDPVTGQQVSAPVNMSFGQGQAQLFAMPPGASATPPSFTMFNPANAPASGGGYAPTYAPQPGSANQGPAPAPVQSDFSNPPTQQQYQQEQQYQQPPAASPAPMPSQSPFPAPPSQQQQQPYQQPIPAARSPAPIQPASFPAHLSQQQPPANSFPTPPQAPVGDNSFSVPRFQPPPAPPGVQLFTKRSASAESATSVFSTPSNDGGVQPKSESSGHDTSPAAPEVSKGSAANPVPSSDAATHNNSTLTENNAIALQQPPVEETRSAVSLFTQPPAAAATPASSLFDRPAGGQSAAAAFKSMRSANTKDAPSGSVTNEQTDMQSTTLEKSESETKQSDGGGIDEDEMDDVPLSPDVKVEGRAKPDPANVPAPSTFSLPMPPPPFSKR